MQTVTIFSLFIEFLALRLCSPLSYSTPFYMYDSAEWSELIEGCRKSDRSDHPVHFKSEYNAIIQLHDHPWRVYEPEEALLFVIPLMLGTASIGMCRLSYDQIAKKATRLLVNNEYFNRYQGSDHFLLNTDWRVRAIKGPLSLAFKNVIFGIQEHYKNHRKFHIERCDVAVPYGGSYVYSKDNDKPASSVQSDVYTEFTAKKFYTFFIGQIGTNWAYSDRYHGFLNINDSNMHQPRVFATSSNSKF